MAWDKTNSGRGGSKWRAKRARVFNRDQYLCQICKRNQKITPVALHGAKHGICDHIKPLAEGGTDKEEDLQCICQACDRLKTFNESAHGRGVPPAEHSTKPFYKNVGLDGWPTDPDHPANRPGNV
ncbi:MAG: HNH endonuclease [Betaproteobacteria bacterium]|nr:MAG: HNH endonuclease [Betaproteobacteria bacterium]